MNEQQRAEEHLKVIRELMERATIYRAISAPTALTGGLLAVALAWLPMDWKTTGGDWAFRVTWGITLLLTLAANTLYISTEAKRRGDPIISPGMKMALRAVLPAMLVGGFFFFLLSCVSAPPILMLFYGLALLATGHFAPRSISFLGAAFTAAGCLDSLWVFRYGPGATYPYQAMGATFGLFHLFYAASAWPRRAR